MKVISVDALVDAQKVLMDVSKNYETGQSGESILIEAHRLLNIEIRIQKEHLEQK